MSGRAAAPVGDGPRPDAKGWTRPQGPPLVLVDGAGRRIWRALRTLLPAAPADVCATRDPWALAAAVHDAAAAGIRAFVCCGGDAAWLAVTAGLSAHGHDGEFVVGHGGGTASLPRAFGLAPEPRHCVARLLGGGEVALDTIRIEPKRGEPTEAANAVWSGFGRLAGFCAGPAGHWGSALRAAAQYPFRDFVDLTFGQVERTYRASGLLVANGQFCGDLDVAPRAHPGDGKLEVLVFCGRASDLWRMVPRMRGGQHLPHPRVRELRPAAVQITTTGTRLWADGIDVARTPATLSARPGRLRVAV